MAGVQTLLAVALLLVTASAVGAVLQALLPGLPFAAVMVFVSMVGPPDPVAATAVAAQLQLLPPADQHPGR